MALAHNPPNTIHLGGPIEKLNEWPAGVVITPGMEIEFYDDNGKMKLRPLASATQRPTSIFALEKTLHNKTVDDTYAVDELVLAAKFLPGSSVWGMTVSGQNLVAGDYMQPNGDGWHKKATSTAAGDGLAVYQTMESTGGAVTENTRLRMHVI